MKTMKLSKALGSYRKKYSKRRLMDEVFWEIYCIHGNKVNEDNEVTLTHPSCRHLSAERPDDCVAAVAVAAAVMVFAVMVLAAIVAR